MFGIKSYTSAGYYRPGDRVSTFRNIVSRRSESLKLLTYINSESTASERIPVSSHSNGSEPIFATISRGKLYEAIIGSRAAITKGEELSTVEKNFGRLWNYYKSETWERAREQAHDKPPVIYVSAFISADKNFSFSGIYTTEDKIKEISDPTVKLEILEDDQLIPHCKEPDVLEAVAIFNSIISHENRRKGVGIHPNEPWELLGS